MTNGIFQRKVILEYLKILVSQGKGTDIWGKEQGCKMGWNKSVVWPLGYVLVGRRDGIEYLESRTPDSDWERLSHVLQDNVSKTT
jgi:hypothetical protein